jgi:hypothetical protein
VFLAAYEGRPDGQTVSVIEFDKAWNVVGDFEVTGDVDPGDGITWNHRSQNLVVVDLGASLLIEVTPEGEHVRTVTTPCMAGVTFNIPTGTYFGVCPDATMWEIATDGTVRR